jgi:hypothetical protein
MDKEMMSMQYDNIAVFDIGGTWFRAEIYNNK